MTTQPSSSRSSGPPTELPRWKKFLFAFLLTAIVVGVATLSLGLALVVRIKEAYGTVEEDSPAPKGRHCLARGETPGARQGKGDP